MQIKITFEEASTAGFISWNRLAKELFVKGGELGPNEHVVIFDVGERGINYFVSKGPTSPVEDSGRPVPMHGSGPDNQ